MELYILRHGIAEDHCAEAPGDDSRRRLTAEGKTKMRRAAMGMKTLELEFDLILSSPYLRAKETAEIVAEVFGMEKILEISPTLASEGGNPRELIEELRRKYGKRKQVLLVGHEPYLSQLIAVLVSGEATMAITMKKGGLCKVFATSLVYGRCATLEWLMTPGQMRTMG